MAPDAPLWRRRLPFEPSVALGLVLAAAACASLRGFATELIRRLLRRPPESPRRSLAEDAPVERSAPAREVRKLSAWSAEDVPARLRPEFYFDFQAHPFEHAELLTSAHDVVDALGRIHDYATQWLASQLPIRRAQQLEANVSRVLASTKIVGRPPAVFVTRGDPEKGGTVFAPSELIGDLRPTDDGPRHTLHVGRGAAILGGTFDLRAGCIYLGPNVTVEPGVHIAGPAIIGEGTTLRHGAYVRGDVIVGKRAVLRGELKNAIIMDNAELAHPGYAGDSIIGNHGHFGCQALTANLGLFGAELSLDLPLATDDDDGIRVSLGRRKVGLILGDGSQLGCNTVTDPATFIGPRTHVYPLARLSSGCYGPDEIVKNKPEASGALVRERLTRR